MRLFFSKTSPFARKVRACIIAHGLEDRVELVETDFLVPSQEFVAANPLRRIPTLVTDDGEPLFDSAVICEYLDRIAGGLPLVPSGGAARWACRRTEALADGVMDNVVARTQILRAGLESGNPLIQRHEGAIRRFADQLDVQVPDPHLDLGAIAIVCALGFLDLRYQELCWRRGRAGLAAWFDTMSGTHRCLGETAPPA